MREYYLLHHSTELRRFYRLNEHGIYEPMPVAPDGVVRSEVLPGFQWRPDDLDRQPPMEMLMTDPVYQGYVWLNYQREQARADQERARADQERARAERLAARLRALGVDIDAEG